MKVVISFIIIISGMFFTGGCKKYLDLKSNQNLSVPDNLEDIELLLNNAGELNIGMVAANAGSDEYYLLTADWESLDQFSMESYIWNGAAQDTYDWAFFYRAIFNANTILENLDKTDRSSDPAKWDDLKGRALFLRAFNFYQLLQVYAPHYVGNESSALGLPIRLSSDFNKAVSRSSLKQSYDQLLLDIRDATRLLPPVNTHATQPSRRASFALLARVHLLLGNYQLAYDFSDSCLKISSGLIDYNTVSEEPEFPLPGLTSNPEVIYYTATDIPVNAYYWMARVDSTLHDSFDADDLRTKLFFIDNGDGTYAFKGNYTASYLLFNGLAVDEIYLTKAEAGVRTGKTTEALKAINDLLESRWATGMYQAITTTDPAQLLAVILQERKKELMFRGTRWSDLRRLNTDPAFRTTIKRTLNSQEYMLTPGDLRYTWLIPQQSINISGIPQNPR
ncbi:MAG: RagB/SusD family nutrient uptake outer membrane protein [Pseudobacter sp.]|uniref:RagB/SusD family nutrient uptake outer membrane protein n=1 Tax=Pseudobacter sp. TaxID=2045420 RepID=UPI003F821113